MDENPYKSPKSPGAQLFRRWPLSNGYRVLALSIAVVAGIVLGAALGTAGMEIGVVVPWAPNGDHRGKLPLPIFVGGLLGYLIVELTFRKESLPKN